MSGSGRASFKSYVSEVTSEAKKHKKLLAAYEKMYQRPDEGVQRMLLPGEIITGHASKVIKYRPHDEPARGVSGSLVCTNFRVLFVAADRVTYDLNELNNRLLGKHDIPLSNIDSLYVEYPNKRKRLVPSSKVKEEVQRLEIHCKDFRVSAFNFKLTVKFEEQGIVKAILHHSYPSTLSLLFAFDHQHDADIDRAYKRSGVPSYRSYADWQALLSQHDVEESWRVTSLNQQFIVSPTMSEFFVVPKTMNDNDLKTAANQFVDSRVPVWCWSAPNGCALVRSSELRPDTDRGEVEKQIYDKIQANGSKHDMKVIDVGKLCPSHVQIQQNFIKLKNLCLITSLDDFYSADSSWLGSLHASRWLQNVATLLTVASDVLHLIRVKQLHVVVRESSGVDVSPVITSLIQILAEPSCRTICGFQSLIQREWVAAGFPFLDRLGHLHQPAKPKGNALLPSDSATALSPVFLMFLDCVWQLTQQFPSSFEFTSVYLIVLHDSTRVGVFDTFLFNNERQRERAIHAPERIEYSKKDPPPVWDWGLQFDDESRKLFLNPFYRFVEATFSVPTSPSLPSASSLSLSLDSLDISDSPSSNAFEERPRSPSNHVIDDAGGMQLHYNSTTGVLSTGVETEDRKKRNRFSISRKFPRGKSHSTESSTTVKLSDASVPESQSTDEEGKGAILTPRTCLASLNLWSSCYFRWSPWSQALGGAPAATFQRHSTLYDEIHQLQRKISLLENQLNDVNMRQSDVVDEDSGMYFKHQPLVTEPQLEGKRGSLSHNFFPFVPVQSSASKSVVGSAFPNYHRSGSILSSRNRAKHVRSSSDISVPNPGEEDPFVSSQSLNEIGEERRRSASAQPPKPPEQSAKPKKKVALMPPSHRPQPRDSPPKECITYISSV